MIDMMVCYNNSTIGQKNYMVQEATACCSQISCQIKRREKTLQISASLSISARYELGVNKCMYIFCIRTTDFLVLKGITPTGKSPYQEISYMLFKVTDISHINLNKLTKTNVQARIQICITFRITNNYIKRGPLPTESFSLQLRKEIVTYVSV